MENNNNEKGTVCVTGATGFIAAHIVKMLLDEGWNVRATVRSTKDESKIQFLKDLQHGSGSLTFFEANLTDDGSFDEAIQGCDYVLHTASPYILTVNDPQKELVDPAVKGTLTVLQSASKVDSVKRVVLTSSMAAITDSPVNGHVYTEADWNKESSLTRNPYYYSKRMAEEAAWDYVETNKPKWDLIVINPFIVIGPELSPSGVNTSNQIIADLLSGKFPGILGLAWGFVDVRDVAKAHVNAMKIKEAKGRYMLVAKTVKMEDVVKKILKPEYENYSIPSINLTGSFGNVAVKMISYLQSSGVGSYLRTNVGRFCEFDSSKARNELGLDFIQPEVSIPDTINNLIERNQLPEKRKSKL